MLLIIKVTLDEFSEWTDTNKLRLNPTKCQALQVCFKTESPEPAELKISGVPLSCVSEAKILGIWIQNDLKWDKNVNEDHQES